MVFEFKLSFLLLYRKQIILDFYDSKNEVELQYFKNSSTDIDIIFYDFILYHQ